MAKGTVKKRNRFVVDRSAFPPSTQVQHLSDEEWEQFIETCCAQRTEADHQYVRIQRIGAAGDAGRDVEARLNERLETDQWDLYQGKHYKDPLSPTSFFPELAKFFCHLAARTYPRPRFYYICSPKNAGPDLHDLLEDSVRFKQRFIDDWKNKKTGLKKWAASLTPTVLEHIQEFPFQRIKECLLKDLLRWHELDRAAHFRMFHIEPERGDDPAVPTSPRDDESTYLTQLIAVYSEAANKELCISDVLTSSEFSEHFFACRGEFYCAEGLKRFSRDLFPEDEFGKLLDMVHKGIKSAVFHPKHKSGLERIDAAMGRLGAISITESKLHKRLRGGDLPGTCHHLVNEERLKWLK